MKPRRLTSIFLSLLLVFSTVQPVYATDTAEPVLEMTAESENEIAETVPLEEPAAVTEAPAESPAVEETTPASTEAPEVSSVPEVTEAASANETTAPDTETLTEGPSVEETTSETSETVLETENEEAAPVEETTAPDTEAVTESTETEEAAPAQDFSGQANGVTVKVNAPEGAFPAGTTMSVKRAGAEAVQAAADAVDADVSDVKAVDITFTADGEEIEPAVAINVSLKASEVAEADETVVVHVDDNAQTEVIENTNVEGATVTFEADAFSVYAIVATTPDEPGDDPQISLKEKANVTVNGAGNINEKEISLGALDDTNESLAIDGYDFVDAWFGEVKITGLYSTEDGSSYYATVDGSTITGIAVGDTKEVILNYEIHKETYSIRFAVTVDGKTVYEGAAADSDIDSILQLEGGSSVKQGNTYNFSAIEQDGYSIDGYTVSNGDIQKSENNIYSVTGLGSDATVTFSLKEITDYKISFAGSNTAFTFANRSFNSGSGSQHGIETELDYTADNELSFTLTGLNEWSTNAKVLNQLSITIDGTAAAAEIPDLVNEEKTTVIAKGYVVTVTKETSTARPSYTVVISNPTGGKVRGTIHVQTNFKDTTSSEVWAKQLDGVEPLAYKHGNTTITADGQGDQKSRLQPEVYTYYGRDTSQSSTYYVKLTGEYSAEDLYLYVWNYEVDNANPTAIIERTKVSALQTINNTSISGYASTDRYFTIPADSGSMKYTDIRIYIKYEPDPDAEYTVWYDTDNGGTNYQKPTTALKLNDSVTLDETIPVKDGYVFDGWYLEKDADTVYEAGDLFTITDDNVRYATSDQFIFKAHWTALAEAKYANFRVEIYFENENHEYNDEADIVTTERGSIGSKAYIIPSELNEKLAAYDAKWEETYVYDKQETDAAISGDGSTVLKVYYKRNATEVIWYANNGTGDSVTDRIVLNQPVNIRPSTEFTYKGYSFVGWAKDANATEAWLKYDAENKSFTCIVDGEEKTVTQIGADNVDLPNALYAIWEEQFFYIYHSSVASASENNGGIEKISMTKTDNGGKYNIYSKTAAGYYYGGYYSNYNKVGTPYAGGAGSWTKAKAYTECGTAMTPVPGTTYYLKEVPKSYLQPYIHVVYDERSQEIKNKLKQMYLITGVDDMNYTELGLDVTNITLGTKKQVASFKVQNSVGSAASTTLTTKLIWGVSGYLGVWDQTKDLKANYEFTYRPYFVTPDGVKVTGDTVRTVNTQNNHYYGTFDKTEGNLGIYRIDN